MTDLRQYLLSVITAAVLCSVLLTLTEKNSASGGLLRILCGMFMVAAFLSPIVNLRLGNMELYFAEMQSEVGAAVNAGTASAEEALSDIIKARSEAYILDKAESMGLSISVEVVLSDDELPQPGSVRIRGTVPPYARAQLRAWIRDTMGIGEEYQLWM